MSSAQPELATSIDRALDVLFHLHEARGPRGVTAIGRALHMPKSSAHRLLAALARRGLVEHDAGGRYRPGVALVSLGLGALDREPIVAAARPVLEEAADRIGETCFLTAARAGRIHVLDKAEGSGFLRAAPRVGSAVPVHATAVGKLQLAFAPESVAAPGPAAERFTDRTELDPAARAREVALVRVRGFAESRDEWIPGLSVVAAPVFRARALVGAVAVALPSVRLASLGAAELAEQVCRAAERVGARLEGRADAAPEPGAEPQNERPAEPRAEGHTS